jgi:hypothetical protein
MADQNESQLDVTLRQEDPVQQDERAGAGELHQQEDHQQEVNRGDVPVLPDDADRVQAGDAAANNDADDANNDQQQVDGAGQQDGADANNDADDANNDEQRVGGADQQNGDNPDNDRPLGPPPREEWVNG